jgi:flagellar hook assembly protein FlgD
VKIEVYNAIGQLIATLVDAYQVAGHKLITWNGQSDTGLHVGSGIYIYRMTADDLVASGRMLLVK